MPSLLSAISLDAFLESKRVAFWGSMPPGSELGFEPGSARACVEVDAEGFSSCLSTLIHSLKGPVRLSTSRRHFPGSSREGLAAGEYVQLSIESLIGATPPAEVFEADGSPEFHSAFDSFASWRGAVLVDPAGYRILLPCAEGVGEPPPRETLLVVDDEESIRTLMQKVLEREGYQVLAAAGGEEALAAARTYLGTIHLLISDVLMAGMGGAELAGHFASLHPEAGVLFVSGYTGEASDSLQHLRFPIDLLPKPFKLADFLVRVRAALDHGAGRAAGASA
jgi:CheY-like chemotaxis protein